MQLSSTFQWVNIPGNLKHIMDKIVGTDKLGDSGGRNRSKIKQKNLKNGQKSISGELRKQISVSPIIILTVHWMSCRLTSEFYKEKKWARGTWNHSERSYLYLKPHVLLTIEQLGKCALNIIHVLIFRTSGCDKAKLEDRSKRKGVESHGLWKARNLPLQQP